MGGVKPCVFIDYCSVGKYEPYVSKSGLYKCLIKNVEHTGRYFGIFVMMSLVLAIETSEQICSVALFQSSELLSFKEKNHANVHSQFLFTLIHELFAENELSIQNIDAVAVNLGPGSYTGLRIGCTAAKSIAYSIGCPVIGVEGLELMASAYLNELSDKEALNDGDMICSMIDARRMEVFWQFFNSGGERLSEPEPALLEEVENPYKNLNGQLHVIGSGASKCAKLESFEGAIIDDAVLLHAKYMGPLLSEKMDKKEFEDLAYFEPKYLKGFHFIPPKNKSASSNG